MMMKDKPNIFAFSNYLKNYIISADEFKRKNIGRNEIFSSLSLYLNIYLFLKVKLHNFRE